MLSPGYDPVYWILIKYSHFTLANVWARHIHYLNDAIIWLNISFNIFSSVVMNLRLAVALIIFAYSSFISSKGICLTMPPVHHIRGVILVVFNGLN